jgi:WD40 repeat protein
VLWRVQTTIGSGSLAAIYTGPTAPVTSLAFTRDGTHIVTGGADAVARVWDAQPDQQLTLVAHAPGAALAARWAGRQIVALWSSGVLATFDSVTHRRLQVLEGPTPVHATALAVSPDAAVVASAAADGSVTAWNRRTGAKLWGQFSLPAVSALAVSPEGKTVVAADVRSILGFSAASGHVLWTATAPGQVRSLAFSPSGDAFLAAGAAGVVVLDARSGARLQKLRPRAAVTNAVYSPDGSRIAAAGGDGVLRIWFAKDGTLDRSRRAGTKPLTGVAFSGTSGTVATSSADSDAHVWDVRSGAGLVLQRASGGPLQAIGLDATGEWAVGAAPTSAIIWNTTSGAMLAYLRGHGSLLTSASFAPKTETVLTSSRDGTIRTYACEVCVDLGGLVHLAERRLAQTR